MTNLKSVSLLTSMAAAAISVAVGCGGGETGSTSSSGSVSATNDPAYAFLTIDLKKGQPLKDVSALFTGCGPYMPPPDHYRAHYPSAQNALNAEGNEIVGSIDMCAVIPNTTPVSGKDRRSFLVPEPVLFAEASDATANPGPQQICDSSEGNYHSLFIYNPTTKAGLLSLDNAYILPADPAEWQIYDNHIIPLPDKGTSFQIACVPVKNNPDYNP